MSRTDDVQVARAAADEWSAARGLPPSGGYSGDWYLNGYMGGWWPEGWVYWVADYGSDAGSRIHPMAPVHQYTSSPIDCDVMLESEIVSESGGGGGGDVDDQERKEYEDRINGLVNALGYVAGDVVQPLRRRTAAKYVKETVAKIDQVAEQFGVTHG